jgi:hypothetical protein
MPRCAARCEAEVRTRATTASRRRPSRSLPPLSLGECRHRGLARCPHRAMGGHSILVMPVSASLLVHFLQVCVSSALAWSVAKVKPWPARSPRCSHRRRRPAVRGRGAEWREETAAKFAPIATALIALVASCIAFFYKRFKQLSPTIKELLAKPDLTNTQEYHDIRAFLNICELIAVGINEGAFSDRVSSAYWGMWRSTTATVPVPYSRAHCTGSAFAWSFLPLLLCWVLFGLGGDPRQRAAGISSWSSCAASRLVDGAARLLLQTSRTVAAPR